ncbi:MAG: hypothetical protein JKY46_02660 [Robiginitomaculum sp.]|nr:hypothetical protein [Robiginitomaculum sp.]
MKRRDVLKIGLGGIASLTPAMALAEYRGPNRRSYENWVLLCLSMEKTASYYGGLYRQIANTVAHSGIPFERITRPSQSNVIGNFTEFYYGQPSPVFHSRLHMEGNDPLGYFVAAKLGGSVLKPSLLIGDMYGNRFDRHWPVDGHVGAFRSWVRPKDSVDFPFSPGYIASRAGVTTFAEEWSGGHQITIDEMLIIPASTANVSDPKAFTTLFRKIGTSPPSSVLPPAGILRRSIP